MSFRFNDRIIVTNPSSGFYGLRGFFKESGFSALYCRVQFDGKGILSLVSECNIELESHYDAKIIRKIIGNDILRCSYKKNENAIQS